MKHLIALLLALGAMLAITPTANAHDGCGRRIVSYTACGRPIYAHLEVYGYDRCGSPIGRWVTDYYRCGCAVCNPRPVYSYPSYSYPSYGGGYRYDRGCGNHSSRSGFYFSFGR